MDYIVLTTLLHLLAYRLLRQTAGEVRPMLNHLTNPGLPSSTSLRTTIPACRLEAGRTGDRPFRRRRFSESGCQEHRYLLKRRGQALHLESPDSDYRHVLTSRRHL